MRKLLIPVLVLIAAEVAILVLLGDLIGFWWTVALLVAAGVFGTWLVRLEGTRTLTEIKHELEAHRTPTDAMLDALLILVGALLLIVPGFLSDIAGLSLLLRPVRRRLRETVRRKLPRADWSTFAPRRGQVIDIEPEREDPPR